MPKDNLNTAPDGCANEPIRIPGLIQPIGTLLGVRRHDLRIDYAAKNVEAFLGLPPQALFGQPLSRVLPPDRIAALCQEICAAKTRVPCGTIMLDGYQLFVFASVSGAHVVVEFEPVNEAVMGDDQIARTVSALQTNLEEPDNVLDFLDKAVSTLRTVSGYDRVLAFRFDEEFNGEVLSESRAPEMDELLGLRFPSWDIPPQARGLMAQLPLRFIADTRQTLVPLCKATRALSPLDMTQAHLRGASPIHMRYLTNMGLRATMTMPILLRDRTWGFLSFHNKAPFVPSVFLRGVLTLSAPLLSARLQYLLLAQEADRTAAADKIRNQVQTEIDLDMSVEWPLEHYAKAVLNAFSADGIFIYAGGEQITKGLCPPDRFIQRIRGLARMEKRRVWQSNRLPVDMDTTVDTLNGVCGAICLETADGRSVLLFRNEKIRQVKWAGAPQKDLRMEHGRTRLKPRASFSAYSELVCGTSDPWQEQDLSVVTGIAQAVLAANQRRLVVAAMRRQKDLVVNELNHRVRNTLSLVRSISRQTTAQHEDIDTYVGALDNRLNALAIAQDLCTQSGSGPVSIADIIQLEGRPYYEPDAPRILISGPDIQIVPEAVSIMALAIHELIANAAKYGALSVPGGRVHIRLAASDRCINMYWQEKGGPPVSPPTREGFGTQLITRAVPFELHGRSELTHDPEGLKVELTIDRDFITVQKKQMTTMDAPSGEARPARRASGTILVLEDNFMIANDLSLTLSDMGYDDVELASNLDDAQKLITECDITLAILDVNIGRGRTSIDLAYELKERGVPFFFVTGYGQRAPLPDDFSSVIRLTKPVLTSDLHATISTVLTPLEAA